MSFMRTNGRLYIKLSLLLLIGVLILSYGGLCEEKARRIITGSSAVPQPPSNLVTAAVSATQVDLAWSDNANNEDGFRIERRAADSTDYLLLATVAPNIASYSDTTVTELTSYYYRVIAYNAVGDSDPSNIAAVTTPWTITSLDTLGNVGGHTAMALDSNEKVHISYYDYSNADLKYITNISGTWVSAVVDSNGEAGEFSSIAVDHNNNVHISYYDRTNAHLKYTTNASGSWQTSTIDPQEHNGFYSSIGIDSNNKVYIAYYDSTNTDLKYATNLTGTWQTSVIDSIGYVGLFCSLAVDSNDKIHISYYDQTNGNLKYATNQSSGWVTSTVDSTGDVGFYTDIAVDSNNKVHISYGDWGNRDLKYSTNSSGSWQTSSIDIGGEVGDYTSMVVDSKDNPHISYYDSTNKSLKYITKQDSGEWLSTIIDRNGCGEYSSIVLGHNTTHISYLDNRNWDLKYAVNSKGIWLVSPPTNLVATAVSAGQIDLSWQDNSNDEAGFRIERKTTNGNYIEIASVLSNTNYYSDSSVVVATTYDYRVKGWNQYGNSLYSNEASATSLYTPPPAPTLVSPENGAVAVSPSPVFNWQPASYTTSYQIQISQNQDFAIQVVDIELSQTSLAITSALSQLTAYYWRVKGKNPGGAGEWSAPWSFTTSVAPPTLASPTDNTVNLEINPTLSWNAVVGVTSYSLQVATDSNFSNIVIDQPDISTVSYPISGLINSTTYYWRVRSDHTTSASPWTSARSFTTIVAVPPQPVLGLPANTASGVSTRPAFSWPDATDASSYRIQVASNADFSNIIIDQAGLAITSYQSAELNFLSTYYWRVNATNIAGTSPWSSAWSFVTTISAPTLSAPANNSFGMPLNPTLAWNYSTSQTTYQLQVAVDNTFQVTSIDQPGITNTYWTLSSAFLAHNTMYYWRVRASNISGISDWSAIWTFATVVGEAVLVLPANNADGVTTAPLLSWNAPSGATAYRLQMATDQNFTNVILDQSGVANTAFQTSGLSNWTDYYWRVMASNAGGPGNWSAVSRFTTIVAVPILSAPVNNTNSIPNTNPSLSWSAVNGATSYRIQVAADDTFNSLVKDQAGITSTSYSNLALTYATNYYWRVQASNAGGTGGWSNTFGFLTIIPPTTLAAPATGSTMQPLNATLQWNSSSYATSYRLQAATLADFSSTVIDLSGIGGTSYQLSGLTSSTLYYWRVQVVSSSQGASYWSTVWSFTTLPPAPSQPALLSPADAATRISINTTLRWNAADYASKYRVQVATDTGFGAKVIDVEITQTSYVITQSLNNLTAYYWRVQASNGSGSSAWSADWSFTTIPAIPDQPNLVSPANGIAGVSLPITMTWNTANNAATYRFRLATDSTFATPLVDQSGLTDTNWSTGGLVYGTTYYWQVQAISSEAEISDWSATWSFRLIGIPVLVFPSDGILISADNYLLAWSPSNDNTSYRLQVSKDPNFATTLVDQTGLVSTSYTVSGLTTWNTYHWRLQGISPNGTSAWSTSWSISRELSSQGGNEGWSYFRPIVITNSGAIRTNYQIPVTPFTDPYFIDNTGLAGSWHFSEGYGNVAADISGNMYNGILDNDLVANWHFNEPAGTISGTTADAGAYSNTGTLYNFNTPDTYGIITPTPGKFGNAISLDGSNDYVYIGNAVPAALQLQSELTLEAWIYATQYPGASNLWTIVGCQRDTNTAGYAIQFDGRTNPDSQTSPPGHIHFQMGNGSTYYTTNVNATVPLNQWVHIAATRKANEDAKVYYNGVLQTSTSVSGWNGTLSYTNAEFAIGRQAEYGDRYFNGIIDEVKIYRRAISDAEVLAHYNAAAPFGDDQQLPAWTDGRFGKALDFDGADNYVNVPFNVINSAQSFSVEAWVKADTLTMPDWQKVIASDRAGGNSWDLCLLSDNVFGFYVWNTAGSSFSARTDSVLPDTWYHLVGVYDSMEGQINIYLNGVGTTPVAMTGTAAESSGPLRIGANILAPATMFDGVIDEVKLYSRALTAAEISARYNYNNPKVRHDYADVRFTNDAMTQELAYWQESDGKFWVKVPSLPNGNTTIRMCYGNPSAANASNGNNVFDLYDPVNRNCTWTKYPYNPVLPLGNGYGSTAIIDSAVIREADGTYTMWYSADSWQIACATSSDGINWRKLFPAPILTTDGSSWWETTYVRASTVTKESDNLYRMWYAGQNASNYRIGYATSTDGFNWTKYVSNPVLNFGLSWEATHVQMPSVLKDDDGSYKMWYMGQGSNWQIGYATSPDEINWIKYNSGASPVLTIGDSGDWDDYHVGAPFVMKESDGIYKMWYSGNDNPNWRIGYAYSSNGIDWTKYGTTSVLNLGADTTWDDYGHYKPYVIREDGTYKMWFSGNDSSNWKGVGYAWCRPRQSASPTPTVSPVGAQEGINAASNFIANVISTSQIDLSWQDNSPVEDGFKLERSWNGINWTQIGTASANATTYSDNTVTATNTYYYRVRAYTLTSDDAYSNQYQTSTTIPSAPTGLMTDTSTSSLIAIGLKWTDNSVSENGFKIERSLTGTYWTEVATVPANTVFYTDGNLPVFSQYYYRVRAYNGIDYSGYSDTIFADTSLAKRGGGNWTYFRNINITNSGSPITDYQVSIVPFTDPNFVNNTGLVGSWHFSEPATATAIADISGSSNPCTLVGAITVNGRFGTGLALNGTSGKYAYGSHIAAYQSNNPTVEAWIKLNSNNLEQTIACDSIRGAFGDGRGFVLGVNNLGKLYFNVGNASGTWKYVYGTTILQTNTWYYVAGVYDGSNLKVYLNGVENGTNNIGPVTISYTEAGSGGPNPSAFYIGIQHNNTDSAPTTTADIVYPFDGIIDEVKIYNRALSGSEITARYNSGNPKVRHDYGDIRFSNADMTQEYPYWPETDNKFWVKLDSVPNGTSSIRMFYGNISATPAGNITNTFLFGDDFSSETVDTGKWSSNSFDPGYYNITGGILKTWSDGVSWRNLAGAYTCVSSTPVIWETFYRTEAVNNTHLYLEDNNNRFCIQPYQSGTTGPRMQYRVNGGSFINGSQYNTAAANTWYIHRIDRQSPTAFRAYTYDTNYTQLGTDAQTQPDWSDIVFVPQIAEYNAINSYIDWLRVRKYVLLEPAVSSPSAQYFINTTTNLVAAVASGTQVNLTWVDNSVYEDSFKIERSFNGTDWVQIDTVGPSITTYADTTVTATNTYYYRVRSYNTGRGDDLASGSVLASTSAPDAPTNLITTMVGASFINLAWTDNSNGEQGFRLERATGGGSWQTVATLGPNTTSYTDTGLNMDTCYGYRVTAFNGLGDSSYVQNGATTGTLNVGTGADGAITIKAIKNINTDILATGRTVADGWNSRVSALTANQATLVSTPPANTFAVNDEVILISLKGDATAYANVGNYEFLRVQSVAGALVTFTANKTLFYGDTAGSDANVGSSQFVMLQRVPNYTNVTVNAGGFLVCSAWDGTTGGVVAFRSNGAVTVKNANGINANGLGFAGGSGTFYNGRANGGESYNGAGGQGGESNVAAGYVGQGGGGGAGDQVTEGSVRYGGTGTVGTGGGGGGGCSEAGWGSTNTRMYGGGGGGGGHGSPGYGGRGLTKGSDGLTSGTGGTGGQSQANTYTTQYAGGGGGGGTDGREDSSTLYQKAYMGGGGGAAGNSYAYSDYNGYTQWYNQPGPSGGNGGGIVFIASNVLNVSSGASIAAGGNNGGPHNGWGSAQPGGAGAGAGGSIILIANQLTNSGAVTANGGRSSPPNNNVYEPGYDGGNGGGGRTYTQCASFSGAVPTPNYWSDNFTILSGTATGGAITISGDYTIHTFTSSGTFDVTGSGEVEVLVVGGGGSGGNHSNTNANGGGGGGGVIYNPAYAVATGGYTVTVGAGGAAIPNATNSIGNNGANSVFGTLTAIGGGGGGSTGQGGVAGSGGSGGGRAYGGGAPGTSTQTGGYGNAGGGGAQTWTGAGGGGAGSPGFSGGQGGGWGGWGDGGFGFACAISGSTVYYAGGGGGGGNSTERAGDGFDGGGRGFGTTAYYSNTSYPVGVNPATRGSSTLDAIANTGGGGGGGSYWAPNGGWTTGSGAGGSGIVIVRYRTVLPAVRDAIALPFKTPTNLAGSSAASNQITITWQDNSPPQEGGFKIERSPDGIGSWVVITTTAANATSYLDTGADIGGLLADTDYWYRCRSWYYGAESAPVTVQTKTASLPPSAPTVLITTTSTAYALGLQWTDNSNNEAGFKIERMVSPTETVYTLVATLSPNTTTYTNSGLAPNTIYNYQVCAYNDFGNSDYSNILINTSSVGFTATGGTVTTDGEYTIHTFTSSGTFQVTGSGDVEVLVVGGGGSGGSRNTTNANGGGGGGGVVYNTSYAVATGPYTVTVGNGGAAIGQSVTSRGNNGANSVFGTLTAIGGGGGGSTGDAAAAYDGGCGGGKAQSGGAAGNSTQTGGYGNAGGNDAQSWTGAGGGGAGSAGIGGSGGSYAAGHGDGGRGFPCSISGLLKYYAGGGGGGGNSTETAGVGWHGGGRGCGWTRYYSAYSYRWEVNEATGGSGVPTAVPNTGGGGGGGSYWSGSGGWSSGSGAGGSGIVIVRYPTPPSYLYGSATGGTITTYGEYNVHTFTSSGTFNVTGSGEVEVLVVGGGGSGGNHNTTNGNGGGGAGGVIYRNRFYVSVGPLTVTVGNGGAAIPNSTNSIGNSGQNSIFGTLTALGGGGGGSTGQGAAAGSGGCGGGKAQGGGAAGSSTQTGGYGNAGGASAVSWTGAGGGGAGSAGNSASGSSDGGAQSGNGGFGYQCGIAGATRFYAGGGGGGGNSSERAGDGYHGGGRGFGATSYYFFNVYTAEVNPITLGSGSLDAIPNTGGGGGGGSYWATNAAWNTGSGAGASGIIIVRYIQR